MWKKIGLVVLGIVIGSILGFVLCISYFGPTFAKGMFIFQEKEVFNVGQTAEEAYYNEPNVVAVWALENYIKTLNNLKQERNPAKLRNLYIILDPNIDLVFTHARLGKIYKQIGNDEKSRYNFEQAISYSKNTVLKSCNTQEGCLKMLDALDEQHSKTSEQH